MFNFKGNRQYTQVMVSALPTELRCIAARLDSNRRHEVAHTYGTYFNFFKKEG
ncbi:MAG: hypothetical protein P4L41_15565 [Flavipsychrobacter sp.]|nr:hypothetical protein [Flavipsychrobacter sp.]